MRRRQRQKEEADLDITSFMNLMIILVPVLLMTMVLSQITVLDINLPLLGGESSDPEDNERTVLEVVIEPEQMVVNYGTLKSLSPVFKIPKKENEQGIVDYDFADLQFKLKQIQIRLNGQGVKKKDILILSQPNTDYQTIIRTMDTVRSYKTTVATSVVDAALFPAISLGDAPALSKGGTAQ